jgi:hypothetical protein
MKLAEAEPAVHRLFETDRAKGSALAQCSPAHRTGNGTQGTSHYHVLILDGEGGEGASCRERIVLCYEGGIDVP